MSLKCAVRRRLKAFLVRHEFGQSGSMVNRWTKGHTSHSEIYESLLWMLASKNATSLTAAVSWRMKKRRGTAGGFPSASSSLQWFDTVGWAPGRASTQQKSAPIIILYGSLFAGL